MDKETKKTLKGFSKNELIKIIIGLSNEIDIVKDMISKHIKEQNRKAA